MHKSGRYQGICLGISGFPYLRTASVKKTIALCRAICDGGNGMLVINTEKIYDSAHTSVSLSGEYMGIRYETLVKDVQRKTGYFARRWARQMSRWREMAYLIAGPGMSKVDFAVLFTNGSFFSLVVYRTILKLRGIRLILVYHEFRSDFEYRKKNPWLRVNDKLFDDFCWWFTDGVLPISEYLVNHLDKSGSKKPKLKIPVLTDPLDYPEMQAGDFFLFCGSAGFEETVEFIIRSFEIANTGEDKLYLVLSGNTTKTTQRVSRSEKKDGIVLMSDLSDGELNALYASARALLIPLKNEVRDIARFPQKIAEYASAGRPIISTSYGEMAYYFSDLENALLCSEYSPEQFAGKLESVREKPSVATEIGKKGKEVALMHFNYKSYVEPLKSFLSQIVNQ